MSGVQLTMQTPAVASAGHDPGGAAGLCAALPAQTSRRPDKPLALTDWPNPRANVYTRCWENKSTQEDVVFSIYGLGFWVTSSAARQC